MKKLIAIILSILMIMCMSVNIFALTPEQRSALSGIDPILDSNSIQCFEKTISDFFKKYPKKELVEYSAQKDIYDFTKNLSFLYFPKKFKDKLENIRVIGIVGGKNYNGYSVIFEENGIDYWYRWGSPNNISEIVSPELQTKYTSSKLINGLTVKQKKFFSDTTNNHIYDRNGYSWTLSDGSSMSLTVYGPEGDYFDYCDMYEYKLNLSNELSAGAPAYENTTPLC